MGRLHHATRHQQQCTASWNCRCGGLVGRAYEQSQWHTGGRQFAHIRVVPQQSGGVSGVDVTDRAKFLVVAAHKGGAGAYTSGRANDAEVEFVAELHHGVGLIQLIAGQALRPFLPEGPVCRLDDAAVFRVCPGYVQQPEENSLRCGARELIEVASDPLAVDHSGNVSSRRSADTPRAWVRQSEPAGSARLKENLIAPAQERPRS